MLDFRMCNLVLLPTAQHFFKGVGITDLDTIFYNQRVETFLLHQIVDKKYQDFIFLKDIVKPVIRAWSIQNDRI